MPIILLQIPMRMLSRCAPDLSAHTTIRRPRALKTAMASTMAHHGASFVIDAIDPVGTMDARVYDLVGELYAFQQPYEPYYTGDMAEEDEDGFIYLVDRKKDVIISGGENLYPVQIEDFLRKHDAIKDVAVIGLPDARLGEIAAAVIEVKEGMTLTEDDINDFCYDMPRYKRPRKIIFADVPRNPTGKIEKPKLREIYCGESLVASQNEIKK